jgi:hypothetical protein
MAGGAAKQANPTEYKVLCMNEVTRSITSI